MGYAGLGETPEHREVELQLLDPQSAGRPRLSYWVGSGS